MSLYLLAVVGCSGTELAECQGGRTTCDNAKAIAEAERDYWRDEPDRFSAIEDGPWQVYADTTGTGFTYAGRVWAFDDTAAGGKTWVERFEGLDSSKMLGASVSWYVTVSDAPNKPPQCSSSAKCGRLEIVSEQRYVNAQAPKRTDDPCYNQADTPTDKCEPTPYYHADGWYKATADVYTPGHSTAEHLIHFDRAASKETLYSKRGLNGTAPPLLFPRRGKVMSAENPKVDWYIKPIAAPSETELANWDAKDVVTTTLN